MAIYAGDSAANRTKLSWLLQQTKGSRWSLIGLSLVVIIGGVINILIAYVLKLFIDIASADTSITLPQVVVLTGIVLAIGGVMYMLASYLRAHATGRIEIKIRNDVINTLMRGQYAEVEIRHSADVMTKLTDDVAMVASCIPTLINDFGGGLVLVLMAIVSLFTLSTNIALCICIAIPLLMAIVSIFNIPISKVDKQRKKDAEDSRVHMQEQIEKILIIKAYMQQNDSMKRLRKRFENAFKSNVRFGAWEGFADFANSLIGNAMLLITLGFGAYLILQNKTTIGTLVAIVQLLNYVLNPLSRVSQAVSKLAQAKISGERIESLLNIPATQAESESSLESNVLELRDIHYAYGEEPPVLSNLNAVFSIGNIYGIVGENGSGKSTLLKLLSQLYSPQQGVLTLPTLGGVVRKVALLPPENFLFSGSIADNITFFANSIDSSKWDIAVRQANVTDLVEKQIAIMEDGKGVSSGQAQRIALARALYYDADILLLDEPTVNLDADSVSMLKATLCDLRDDKIVIIVSHDAALEEIYDTKMTLCDGMLV